LPEWWTAGAHDYPFLVAAGKYGLNVLQQERILLDPQFPFRAIVEKRLVQNGLVVDPETGALKYAVTANAPIDPARGPPPANIEELVGWPKDIIRSRRAEILVELVIDPPDRVAQMLRFHQLKQQGDEDFDYSAARRAGYKMKCGGLGSMGGYESGEEDDEWRVIRKSLAPSDFARFGRMMRLKKVRLSKVIYLCCRLWRCRI
jgi:hypothetical protein